MVGLRNHGHVSLFSLRPGSFHILLCEITDFTTIQRFKTTLDQMGESFLIPNNPTLLPFLFISS